MFNDWTDVKGFEGRYSVNKDGMVYSHLSHKLLKQEITKLGYKRVSLYKDGKPKHFFVHQLVAQTFIPNPLSLPYVNHKDENPNNNNIENLEWCTQKYNINYGTRNLKVSSHARHVRQYTLEGVFLAEYQSAGVAARLLGYSLGNINSCCNGKKKYAYNSLWEYV